MQGYLKIATLSVLSVLINSSCLDVSKTKCAGYGYDSITFDIQTSGNADAVTTFDSQVDFSLAYASTLYTAQCGVDIKADSGILKGSLCYGFVFGSLDIKSNGTSAPYGKCNGNNSVYPTNKKVCKSSCEALVKNSIQYFKDKGCKNANFTSSQDNVTQACTGPFITDDESNCLKISAAFKSVAFNYLFVIVFVVSMVILF